MNKIIAIAVLVAATSASAGFFDNNSWEKDNGVFSYNPYSFFEPRWYIQEANNFMDEIDAENKVTKHNHNFPVQYEQGNQTTYK